MPGRRRPEKKHRSSVNRGIEAGLAGLSEDGASSVLADGQRQFSRLRSHFADQGVGGQRDHDVAHPLPGIRLAWQVSGDVYHLALLALKVEQILLPMPAGDAPGRTMC